MQERFRAVREEGLPPRSWWAMASVVAAVVLASAAVAEVIVLASPWPCVPLIAAEVVVAACPAPRAARLGLAGGLAACVLAVAAASASSQGLVSAASLTIAALGALAVAVWVDRGRAESAAAVAAAHQLLDAVSVIDETTGCYNANGLDLLARHVLGAVRRSSGAMHASLVEVADLTAIADVGGQVAVQEVVCAVADALRSSTRGADVVGRWSPDVFVVLGPGTGVPPAELERRLRSRLVSASGRPTTRWASAVTVGSGLLEPWDGGGLAELVGRAEQDLGLRRALRAPSAAEPTRRRRRTSDRAGDAHGGTPDSSPGASSDRTRDPS